jgi:tetratricopeptide (TPR) repeat protein
MLQLCSGLALADRPVGRVVSFQGEVRVASADGAWSPARVGLELHEGHTVETGQRSRAALLLRDESQVHLNANTRLALSQVAGHGGRRGAISQALLGGSGPSLYRLFFGEVWVRANREAQWDIMSALVGVRGTDFGLWLDAAGEARVWVLDGEVVVAHPLGSILVEALEEARMSRTRAPEKRAILLRPVETVQWVLRYPVWVSPRDLALAAWPGWPSPLAGAVQERDAGQTEAARSSALTLPGAPERDLLLGWLALDLARTPEALGWLKGAPAGHPLTWIGRCLALMQEGRAEAACGVMDEAVGQLGPLPELLLLRAVAQMGAGHPEGGRVVLDAAREPGPAQALARIQSAAVHMVWNAPAPARALADGAVALAPQSPTAHLVRGWTLRARGDLEGALEEAREALIRDPFHLPAALQAVELCMGLGRETEARQHLERARSIAPPGAQVRTVEGFLHLAAWRHADAEAAFQDALAQSPSQWEAHMGLGILRMRWMERIRALEAFGAAVLLEPFAALPQSYLAKALHDSGRSAEALKMLERAADLDPQDPTPHLYRAVILRDLHRPGEALAALEASLARNQGRSVFRSRFLLDQDRAVRNVNLAEAYRDMGLPAWARHRAIAAVRDDPTNSSALAFLSSSFGGEGRGRIWRRALLRSRLMAPVNANLFSTFQDETLLFEAPRLSGEVEAGGGEHASRWGDVLLHGGAGPVAGFLLAHGAETRGFHAENHGERDLFFMADAKARLGPGHEVLLQGESLRWAQGDHQGDADAWWVQDPFLHQKGRVDDVGVGYRWQRAPREEILVHVLWNRLRTDLEDRTTNPWAPGVSLRHDLNWRIDSRSWQLGMVHLGRTGAHRWEWGMHGTWGEDGVEKDDLLRLRAGGTTVLRAPWRDQTGTRPDFVDLHVGDIFEVRPGLFLEAALHAQWFRMGSAPPVHSCRTFSGLKGGPWVGAVWSLSPQDTLRVGWAQYVEPPYTILEGLQPVDVAGFPLGEDAAQGSWNREARLAWERQWRPWAFTRLAGGLRLHRTWEEAPSTRRFQARDLRALDAEAESDLLVFPNLSSALGYRFRHDLWEDVAVPRRLWPGERWSEHRATAELRWVHAAGWYVTLRETGVLQAGDLGPGRRRQEAFWTDLLVERYWGGRRWAVGVGVRNLFDQPFRLRTHELVEEKGLPSREVVAWARLLF